MKLFTHLTKRSSRGNFSLLAHCCNLLFPKQFFLHMTFDWCIYWRKWLERTVQRDRKRKQLNAATNTSVSHDGTHSFVLRMSTAAFKFEKFSNMYALILLKNGFKMTFKNMAHFLTKWHCSVVSWLIEINFFHNGFKSYKIGVYKKDLSYVGSFFICKVIWYQRWFCFGFFQRLVIVGADQKECSLWERDCPRSTYEFLRTC